MADAIEHVVVLMLENRSFDHFLGDIPGVDGVDPANFNLDGTGSATRYSQKPVAVRKMRPDPKHETTHVLRQIQGAGLGPMGGFVADFAAAFPHDATTWPQVMAYFPDNDLPALHELAHHFTVCDQWFSSVPGPTWTNRFFAHSGTSQGWVEMPDPPFHPNLHKYDQTTIYDRLNERNTSWRIYAGDIPQSLLLKNQRMRDNLRRYSPLNAFFRDVGVADASEFPAYVFLEPHYLPFGQTDQHPPHDVLKGDDLIASVYNAIRGNDSLWETTLLIVLWDEHGGFYDHVMPPRAEPPDHNRQERFDFDIYGVRVPALLVSKWTQPGVFRPSAGVLDHTSILRYLSDKFGLGPLGNRTESAPSFAGAITAATNTRAPLRIGMRPRPRLMTETGAALEPRLNKNQAALIEFTKQLESEMGAPPDQIGTRFLRAQASVQGEIEVAKERTWLYIATQSR